MIPETYYAVKITANSPAVDFYRQLAAWVTGYAGDNDDSTAGRFADKGNLDMFEDDLRIHVNHRGWRVAATYKNNDTFILFNTEPSQIQLNHIKDVSAVFFEHFAVIDDVAQYLNVDYMKIENISLIQVVTEHHELISSI